MLTLEDQYNTAVSSWYAADFDRFERLLLAPDSISIEDQRTVAQQLGFKGGFLNAAIDIAADPMVWLGLYMSKRFPTAQYLKGTVPHRLIGAANEFTGLSTVARPVEGFFRGTNIPKLLALQMRRKAEVLQAGNKIFDELITRPNWKNEMPVVSLLLEGQNPSGATPELHALAGRVRGTMNELWGFLGKTYKVEGGFDHAQGVSKATSRPFLPAESPQYLRDYLPHIPLFGDHATIALTGEEALRRFKFAPVAQALQLAQENPASVWGTGERLGSNFARYQSFMQRVGTQVFNPRLFPRLRTGVVLNSETGRDLFVTDLNVILQKYIHGVAQTYSLNAPLSQVERTLAQTSAEDALGRIVIKQPTSEPIVVQIINEGLEATGAKLTQQTVKGTNVVREFVEPASVNAPTFGALRTLVRSVQGMYSEGEIFQGNLIGAVRRKVSESMGLTPRQNVAVESALSSIERNRNGRDLGNRVTSFFYATTLGLNPLSALKNMFQPALTTAPAIGIGPTLAGYKELRQRLPQYFNNFIRERQNLTRNPQLSSVQRINLALEKSFGDTFPEMAKSGLRIDPRMYEVSEAQLLEGKFKSNDHYYKAVLQPFTQTELSNQVVTFYGAKQALRNSLRQGVLDVNVPDHLLPEWLDFEAGNIVNTTQFRPGPGSRTVLQSNMPNLLTMFSSFPVRLGSFVADSMTRGAMTEKQLETAGFFSRLTGGRNMGTVARMFLLGRVVTEGMRETFGVNLADAMGLAGPFNAVTSGRIFDPMTMAPLPSVVKGIASFATTRDVKEMQPLELPVVGQVPIPKTLVPGGIAMTRAVRALRHYQPDMGGFVDDNERLMYQGDTTDLILASLGIPLEKDRRLRQVIDRTEANRLRIREYKRRYAVAARGFDVEEQTTLQSKFAEEFPDMPGLSISRHDLRRYTETAHETSAQRMVKTLGRGASFLEQSIYELDPDLVVSPGESFNPNLSVLAGQQVEPQ